MAATRDGARLTLSTLRQGTTDPRAVETHYDDWAESYDATLARWRYRTPDEVAALLLPHLPPDGARVLDVGCGTGLFGQALVTQAQAAQKARAQAVQAQAQEVPGARAQAVQEAPAGLLLDGMDISAASLDRAAGRGVYDRLMRHDLQALPLPVADGGHDAAAIVGVLTYIPDAEALMRDLCRAVRAGGHIAFTQRSDLWEARGFDAMIAGLEAAGLWRPLHIGPPRPYLPGNADFAEDVAVIHTLCRVA